MKCLAPRRCVVKRAALMHEQGGVRADWQVHHATHTLVCSAWARAGLPFRYELRKQPVQPLVAAVRCLRKWPMVDPVKGKVGVLMQRMWRNQIRRRGAQLHDGILELCLIQLLCLR